MADTTASTEKQLKHIIKWKSEIFCNSNREELNYGYALPYHPHFDSTYTGIYPVMIAYDHDMPNPNKSHHWVSSQHLSRLHELERSSELNHWLQIHYLLDK